LYVNKVGKTSEMTKGFCFAIPVTHLSKPNTGKNDDNRRPGEDGRIILQMSLRK
jgi:hypothetical protein